MVTSLSDLCTRMNVASLVVQVDRRQVADRRKMQRGGRRADDVNPAVDPLDMRSVAIRRTLTSSHLPSVSLVDETTHADQRYSVAAGPADPGTHRFGTTARHRTLD
jgi:hypothetical protein